MKDVVETNDVSVIQLLKKGDQSWKESLMDKVLFDSRPGSRINCNENWIELLLSQKERYIMIEIVNDVSRVVSEWHQNLEHHLELVITLLDLPIMLLEMIYRIGITNEDHDMLVVIYSTSHISNNYLLDRGIMRGL